MRCRDAAVRTTVGEPLGQRQPLGGSRPREWSACMAREEGRELPGQMTQRMDA